MNRYNFRKMFLIILLLCVNLSGMHSTYGMQADQEAESEALLAAAGLDQLMFLQSYTDFVDESTKMLTEQAQRVLAAADTDLKKTTYWQVFISKVLEVVIPEYFKMLRSYYKESIDNHEIPASVRQVPENMSERIWDIFKKYMPKTHSMQVAADGVINVKAVATDACVGVVNLRDAQGQPLGEAVAAIARTLKIVHVIVKKMCEVVVYRNDGKKIKLKGFADCLTQDKLATVAGVQKTFLEVLRESDQLNDDIVSHIDRVNLVEYTKNKLGLVDQNQDDSADANSAADSLLGGGSQDQPKKRGIERRDFSKL